MLLSNNENNGRYTSIMPNYSSKHILNYPNECHQNDKQKTGNNEERDTKIQDRFKHVCSRFDFLVKFITSSLTNLTLFLSFLSFLEFLALQMIKPTTNRSAEMPSKFKVVLL